MSSGLTEGEGMTDQELHRHLTELGFVIEIPVFHVWGTPHSPKTRRSQVERWVNYKFNLTRKRRTPKYPEFLSAFIRKRVS